MNLFQEGFLKIIGFSYLQFQYLAAQLQWKKLVSYSPDSKFCEQKIYFQYTDTYSMFQRIEGSILFTRGASRRRFQDRKIQVAPLPITISIVVILKIPKKLEVDKPPFSTGIKTLIKCVLAMKIISFETRQSCHQDSA